MSKKEPVKKQNNINAFLEPLVKATNTNNIPDDNGLAKNNVDVDDLPLRQRLAWKCKRNYLKVDPDILHIDPDKASLHNENRKRKLDYDPIDELLYSSFVTKTEAPEIPKK